METQSDISHLTGSPTPCNLKGMTYLNVFNHIESLLDKGNDERAVDIRLALNSFPDLKLFDFNGKILLITKDVNPFVDKVDYEWKEDKLLALPYTIDNGVVVRPIPAVFHVARSNPKGFGLIPYDWETQMHKAEISEEVQFEIYKYLESRKPADYV